MTFITDFIGEDMVLVQLGCKLAGHYIMHSDRSKGRFAVKLFKVVNSGTSLEEEQIKRWVNSYGHSEGPGQNLIDSAFMRGKYKDSGLVEPMLYEFNGKTEEDNQKARWGKLQNLTRVVREKCPKEEADAYLYFVACCARNVAEADTEKKNPKGITVSDDEAIALKELADLFQVPLPDFKKP